jgi:hypothetical protein
MSPALTVILSAALLVTLDSCQTTGDPTKGGLFGWSKAKARQDTSAMQRQLDDLESDNVCQQRRTHELEQAASHKQRELEALNQ